MGEQIPLKVAEEFIKATVWWLTHPSGPVRAPGHAKNLYNSDNGWAIDFGANTFLVDVAIARCRTSLNSFLRQVECGHTVSLSTLREQLMKDISGAVANYDGFEYGGYYPLSGTEMIFGSQAIDVREGANFIIHATSTRKYFKQLERGF